MRAAVVISCCFLALSSAIAREVKGVPQIVDADTVYEGTVKIRLLGIDAPETDQVCLDAGGKAWDCGIVARQQLRAFAREQSWNCELTGQDVYRRHLGSCTVSGQDVSRWLVRNGWALAFRRYSTAYVADEDFAREQKRGLWSGAFVAPWEWRHRSNNTVILGAVAVPAQAQRILMAPATVAEPPSPACVIKGNLKGAHECIYHVPGGRFYDRLSMDRSSSRRWFCSVADAEAAGCRKSKL
ncbi:MULTISPECIES: thermonuclease family protein [unclassified Bradyrhizobium]|uniref:thermonuclease family protein n=1 Tax=unclassified Bradyrhizobium TaxID=2631580 RepID=UPI0028F0406A|nr:MULTISPECIES: thermonuclease family protein [unclassified Bradyrhizobium]